MKQQGEMFLKTAQTMKTRMEKRKMKKRERKQKEKKKKKNETTPVLS